MVDETTPLLRVGQLVMLRSGGPMMTVTRTKSAEEKGCVETAWFASGGELFSVWIPIEALVVGGGG